MQESIRGIRIGWLVAIGLIALYWLDLGPLHGEPSYSMVAASTPESLCNVPGTGDECFLRAAFDLTLILLLPAVLLILLLLLASISDAIERRHWLWLAGLVAPPALLIVALLVAVAYTTQGEDLTTITRLLIAITIVADSPILTACAAAAPILGLVYAFLPRRQQASAKMDGATTDIPAAPGG